MVPVQHLLAVLEGHPTVKPETAQPNTAERVPRQTNPATVHFPTTYRLAEASALVAQAFQTRTPVVPSAAVAAAANTAVAAASAQAQPVAGPASPTRPQRQRSSTGLQHFSQSTAE